MKIITTPMDNLPGNRTIVLLANGEQIVYYMEQPVAFKQSREVGHLWFRAVPQDVEKPVSTWLNWYLHKVDPELVTEVNRKELEYMVESL